jgi:hypothetical protein
VDVVPEHLGGAGVRAQQGGEHPDRGRLARAVGAEHAVDGSCPHREVDAVDGANVAEGLDEARCFDRERGGHGGSGD